MKLRRNLIVFVYCLFSPIFAYGSGLCPQEFTKKIETYLNTISKTAITFEQISSDDLNQKGLLLIEKPLKFRVNYDTPHPILIVGGKNFVSLYDYELDELSRVDVNDNIFKFLLELNVSIENTVKIVECTDYQYNIELSLIHKETEQKAKINFTKEPFKLFSLIIPEDGNDFSKGKIELLFGKIHPVKSFDSELFILKDPKVFGQPKRLSSQEILKNLGL